MVPLCNLLLLLAGALHGQIQINVYNGPGVEASTLDQARTQADRILLSGGVHAGWSVCRKDGADCPPPSPATLHVRLYGADAESRFTVSAQALGFAFAPGPGQIGVYIAIFQGRVDALARREGIDVGSLLGHVIAHEAGHLLLGAKEHAVDGIMKFPWRGKYLERLRQGQLLFLPQQGEAIRRDVEARLAASRKPSGSSNGFP